MIDALLMMGLLLTSIFLVLLVLIQRGRGGGLAGAFGGLGGQSAFGTKAGDLFTRVTIVVATVWILLCAISVKYFADDQGQIGNLGGAAVPPPAAAGGMPGVGDAAPGATGAGGAESSATENDTPATVTGPDIPVQSTPPAAAESNEAPAAAPPATMPPATAPPPTTETPAETN